MDYTRHGDEHRYLSTLYPKIAEDYERMFRVLKALPCDFFLGAHGSYFNMDDKYPS